MRTHHVAMATTAAGAGLTWPMPKPKAEMCTFSAGVCVTQFKALCARGSFHQAGVRLFLQCQCYTVNSAQYSTCPRSDSAMHGWGGWKGGQGEEVAKLLRRQILPLFDALMLIHSERTSCLSAYTVSPLLFSMFPDKFLFSVIVLYG